MNTRTLTKFSKGSMRILVLHKNKEHIEECAAVLNEEWPRSKTARIHSLEKSCDKFPLNLVLVNEEDVPIGHSRLSLVIGKENSCFLESVVVKKALRGKGLGKLLMLETEKFAKSEGFKTMYLSTHDKQDFYQHVGYCFCKQVVSCGAQSSNLPKHFLNKLAATSLDEEQEEKSTEKSKPQITNSSNTVSEQDRLLSIPSPPEAPLLPPPPPLPPQTAVPIAPPITAKGDNSNKEFHPEISKWDPREISWMKKDL